jgi:hypothetical protein
MQTSLHISKPIGKLFIIWTIYTVCLLSIGNILAAGETDCTVINALPTTKNILPDTVYRQAQINLWLACCRMSQATNLWYCRTSLFATNTNVYTQSPYILDHLVDVMRRSLDAEPSIQYPWIPLDPAWVKRRAYIDTTLSSITWAIPIQVFQSRSAYRWTDKSSIWISSPDIICPYISSHLTKLTSNRQISDPSSPWYIPLAHKYMGSCAIARCSTASTRQSQKNPADLRYCQAQAHHRIEQEKDLVQLTLIEQGSRATLVNFDNYAINSFTQSWLNPLLDQITQFASLMRVIYKSAGGVTRQCSG